MEFLIILQKRWSFDSVSCWNSSKRENILEMDIWEKFRVDSNPGPQDRQSNTLTTRLRLQLPNRWKIFGIYAISLITDWTVYTEKYKARGPDV